MSLQWKTPRAARCIGREQSSGGGLNLRGCGGSKGCCVTDAATGRHAAMSSKGGKRPSRIAMEALSGPHKPK